MRPPAAIPGPTGLPAPVRSAGRSGESDRARALARVREWAGIVAWTHAHGHGAWRWVVAMWARVHRDGREAGREGWEEKQQGRQWQKSSGRVARAPPSPSPSPCPRAPLPQPPTPPVLFLAVPTPPVPPSPPPALLMLLLLLLLPLRTLPCPRRSGTASPKIRHPLSGRSWCRRKASPSN